ncbi:MAG: hypothetical protein IKD07_04660, partial [Clostridia bacterium]|nr:hypothetical protein [Clostridia bacterium]
MIKHEYQKQNENGTVKNESRNQNRYDAAVIASEKNRMKMLDSKKESDVNSPDVVQYATREAIPTVKTGSFYTTNVYPGSGKGRAQEMKNPPRTDLEKHIYESERYYIDITNGAQKARAAEPEDKKPKKAVPTTVEISAFEPKNITFPEEATQVFQKEAPSENAVTASKANGEKGTQETRAFLGYGIQQQEDDRDSGEFPSFEESEKASDGQTAKKTPEKEYTSVEQNRQIYAELRSKCILSKVRISIAAVLCIVLFLIENVSAVKDMFATPVVYMIVDWILAFACAALVFDRFCLAFRSVFRLKPDADCIMLIAFFMSLAATVVALIAEVPGETLSLFNFPFAVCVLFDTLFVYFSARRDLYSFSVLSSSQKKHAVVLTGPAKCVSADETATEAGEQTSEQEGDMGATYGKIKDVNFIEGYFAHKNETPGAKLPLRIILLFCFCVSAVFFLCALLVMRHSAAESIAVAYATFMMCAPFSAFLAYSYPLYLAARRTYACQSAILCDKTPDLYQDVSMLVFRDTEVFSSEQAKVKSIRLYADKKIDNAIYYASSIYSAIGGPFAGVFKKAALNSFSSENVELVEVCAEGACAMVDGKNIVIGTPAYMEEQCFETVNDPGDEEYEGKTNKRIFYLACDQIVIAKFYIQYTVSSDFLEIANRLFAAGIGIGVATADPCPDVGIFYENKIDPERNAIRVLKGCPDEPAEESVSAEKAG